MVVEATEGRGTVDHGSGVYGSRRSHQGNNFDEGLHRRVRDPKGGNLTLMR